MRKKVIAMALAICLVLCGCSAMPEDPVQAPTESETDRYLLIDDDVDTSGPDEDPTETEVETTAEPTTEATTVPEPEPTLPPAVVITKDPTGEIVFPGERTWFIAHADNATSIVWEVFSPDGMMYSIEEAMSMHPGLVLEVLPEDTLGLRDIPASFDGWSARARFDGPGGTAVTERAKITIRDPYDQIIEKYRKAWKDGAHYMDLGISELVVYADRIGYTTVDLDGNGVKELVIISFGEYFDSALCEVYTKQDGEAVEVVQSWARGRFYLLTDGRLYVEGSSGAVFQSYEIVTLSGTTYDFVERLYTSDEDNGLETPIPHYYHYYSDRSQQDVPIGYDDAVAMIEEWRSQIWIPELTYIS